MICKVCREDLPSNNFYVREYHRARQKPNASARCLDCKKLKPQDAAQKRKDALAILKATKPFSRIEKKRDDRAAWNTLTAEEKRVSRLARQTEMELKVGAYLPEYFPDIEAEYPILRFFVDYASPSQRIAIEIDREKLCKYDYARQEAIRKEGWEVIRFSHAELSDIPTALWKLRPYRAA